MDDVTHVFNKSAALAALELLNQRIDDLLTATNDLGYIIDKVPFKRDMRREREMHYSAFREVHDRLKHCSVMLEKLAKVYPDE